MLNKYKIKILVQLVFTECSKHGFGEQKRLQKPSSCLQVVWLTVLLTWVLKAQLNRLHRLLASVSDLPVSVAKMTVTLALVAITPRISEDAKSTALGREQSHTAWNGATLIQGDSQTS